MAEVALVRQLRIGLVGGVRLPEVALATHDQLQLLHHGRPLHASHNKSGQGAIFHF